MFLKNSLAPKFDLRRLHVDSVISLGLDEVSRVTHPLVHAVEQPITNATYETVTINKEVQQKTNTLFGIAAVVGAGWLTWTLMGEFMPAERNNIKYALHGIGKRLRLT